ncbi:unnamed protein product [Cyclocybe aegerita]|uniref:Plus3 domain-containing protein n=1 Tax=Cyclocybe aegerita TaxID=1973307 RepID=A0A8S0WAN0_CYCAE|nr:unnamed protein product [Cyclocybe aegerita]
MSDFEDDIDDQLLELAGATEKKKKGRQHSSGSAGGGGSKGAAGKKRKHVDSDSEKESFESEEEMQDPFPLEGKYRDEQDKRELLSMTEFRREQILEERAEERQRLQNAKMLADMVRQQQGGGGASADDSVSRAAKRQHQARGATKEKAHKLDELKAKRKAKDDKKRSRAEDSPSQTRGRSSSPQDMDISDEESEDGQITKAEQEDERLLNLSSGYESSHKRSRSGNKEDVPDAPCTMEALETCRLTRDNLAKHFIKPWFQDYVTNAWVRYLIGQEQNGQPVYRICQINNLASDFVKPYKINDKTTNQALELKHGKSMRTFNMDKVSNGPFIEKEWDRLVKTYTSEDVKLPTKQQLEKKVAQMEKLVNQPMTEGDISVMLTRKAQLQTSKGSGLSTLERSRLIQQRTLAIRRQDYEEVAEIEAKLEEAKPTTPPKLETEDMLARVNERNRKANLEAIRQQEIAEAEKKRRERKLKELGSKPSTPRPGTPVVNGEDLFAATVAKVSVKPGSTFEASLIDSVEIDLGDF